MDPNSHVNDNEMSSPLTILTPPATAWYPEASAATWAWRCALREAIWSRARDMRASSRSRCAASACLAFIRVDASVKSAAAEGSVVDLKKGLEGSLTEKATKAVRCLIVSYPKDGC